MSNPETGDIVYPPIGGTGTADITVDLTGELETSEVLTGTQDVTSEDTDVLTLGTPTINSSELTKKNGTTVAIGKAISFKVTQVLDVNRHVKITVDFAGDSNTSGTYKVFQQLKTVLP